MSYTSGMQNNNLSTKIDQANTIRWISGRNYDGYKDLLSYIAHLWLHQEILNGRFDGYNLYDLPTQNWDYIIDFTYINSGQSLMVKAHSFFGYTDYVRYASKQANGTYAWTDVWKSRTFA